MKVFITLNMGGGGGCRDGLLMAPEMGWPWMLMPTVLFLVFFVLLSAFDLLRFAVICFLLFTINVI